jgi:hypothetical protein
MGKNTRLKKLARHLLATTCLTAGAAALANAQVVTEGSGGAPADFGNTFGAAYLLPDGTIQVNGGVSFGSDPAIFYISRRSGWRNRLQLHGFDSWDQVNRARHFQQLGHPAWVDGFFHLHRERSWERRCPSRRNTDV